MRNQTPFFKAFGPLLFGRAKRSAIDSLISSKEPRSLSQFQEAFGEYIPTALLASPNASGNSRQRCFPALITFWAFLAQVLERGSSCRDALRRITAWSRWEDRTSEIRSQSTSAYCQARARLCENVLEKIGIQISDRLIRHIPSKELWRGHEVKVVDGTGVSMPDTPENQAAWPQPSSQKPGCGFPVLKLVGLLCLSSGALIRTVIGECSVHDSLLVRQLWDHIADGDVVLADRAFCSYFNIFQILRRKADSVMRLHQARSSDFRRGKALGRNDRWITWTKPARRPENCSPEQWAELPAVQTLRMIRYRTCAPGFRTAEVVLVTTLLDPALYPKEALAALYFQRWGVELHFREIKTLLGMDVLRCLTPEMIKRELQMHFIAYNLVRTLMQRAAISHEVRLARISFKGTLDSLAHFANAIHASSGKPRKQADLLEDLLLIIATDLLPIRPFRSEPRARKRRPKNYVLMTRPRREMKHTQHRNRWRAECPKPSLT